MDSERASEGFQHPGPARGIVIAGLVLAMLAAGLLGCGGDEKLNREQIIAEASAICAKASGRARLYAVSNEPPRGAAEVAAALGEDVRIGESAVRRLEELRPDEDAEAEFEEFRSAEAEAVDRTADAEAAAEAADPERLEEANAQILAATGRAKKSADDYGLDGCPPRPVSVFYAGAGPGGASQDDRPQSTVGGTWSGQVTQIDPDGERSRYQVTMTVAADPQAGRIAGTIEYPSLPCGGDIRLSARFDDLYVFDELIRQGRRNCEGGGEIAATVAGETMSWHWDHPDVGTVVRGVLQREG